MRICGSADLCERLEIPRLSAYGITVGDLDDISAQGRADKQHERQPDRTLG